MEKPEHPYRISQVAVVVRDIDAAMNGNLCRCGTHQRILRAMMRAAGRRSKSSALLT